MLARRFALALAPLLFTLSLGCSDDPSSTTTGGATTSTGAGGGGAGGGAPGCPPGTHEVESGCDTTLSWTKGPDIPEARDHHTSFVEESDPGAFLYVIGGTDRKKMMSDVLLAKIGDDGSLGDWQKTTAMPAGRAGHATVVLNRSVIVIGGYTNSGPTATTIRATLNADGTISAWDKAPPIPQGCLHHTAITYEGRVYVLGGNIGTKSLDTVVRASLNADGTLSDWESLAPLPAPRSHHAIAQRGRRLWLIAGLDGNPAAPHEDLQDIITAEIADDGTIGEWTKVSDLPVTVATHSAFIFADHLYVVGGVEENADFVASLRRASIADDGTLGAWEDVTPPLPTNRGHVHQTPIYKTWLYSVGGSQSGMSVLADVDIATFQ